MFRHRQHNIPINTSAVDPGDFGAGTVDEILMGLVQSEESLIDQIAGLELNPKKLDGTVDIDPSESGIARGENQDLEPGEEATAAQGAVTTLSFDAKAQVGQSLLRDESRGLFEAGSVDALARELKIAVRDANKAFDRKALGTGGVLASTTLNEEFDATSDGAAAWDDGGTASTPVTDIREMKEVKAPGSDTIMYGRKIKNALMIHPDVIAEVSNFSGGTMGQTQLEAWLRAKFGFQHVIDLSELSATYNSAAKGSLTVSYLFETSCWIGHRRAIVVFNPDVPDQNSLEQERLTTRRSYLTQFTRYSDVRRPVKELGSILTNGAS